jgi:3'-phosphoadenosine 5'-phosphosulfate (PAPS) 3'-phosphatase/thiamine kinase-like enzyme
VSLIIQSEIVCVPGGGIVLKGFRFTSAPRPELRHFYCIACLIIPDVFLFSTTDNGQWTIHNGHHYLVACVSMPSVPTLQLLSGLIDATHHGSSTIRSLSVDARQSVQYKEKGEARSAMTVADTAAQKIIVSSLLKSFPSLNIVGEEDESVELDESVAVDLNLALNLDFSGIHDELMPQQVDFKDICVFVDPLDGTREFVEGRLNNVQCLVGLCHRGTPFMGAIGLPFGNATGEIEVVYGVVGRGIGKLRVKDDSVMEKLELPELKKYKEGDTVFLSSGDSRGSLLQDSVRVIERTLPALQRQIMGASGNKMLKVTTGESTLSVMHDKTSLWDTCAPTAILSAVGGKVSDLFGEPLIYNPRELGNKLGVVSSVTGANHLHDQVTTNLRSDAKVLSVLSEATGNKEPTEAQCVDIVRDLDGYPLNKSFFEKIFGGDLRSYTCPEREAVRGLMSNGCRLHLEMADGSQKSTFYKRIVFSHLEHARNKLKTAPHKLVRDVKSYRVETSFLTSTACQQLIQKTGLRIPQCHHAELRPDDENPIESRFSVLLEDFSPKDGWSQRWLIRSKDDAHAVLSTFAKLHAFFWSGSDFWRNDEAACKELVEAVWKSASYVQPALQTLNQCNQVEEEWNKKRDMCRNELETFEYWDNLGARLQSVSEQVGRDAHPFHDEDDKTLEQFKTLIHGDPKQTNIFFQQDESGGDLQVGLIDFQWSGFGLAASDIAHHMSAALRADLLEGTGEKELLEYYYQKLTKYLVEYGAYTSPEKVAENYSFTVFMEQYETAILDMCRLVIAYAWSRFEPVTDEKDYSRTANKNSYNKSLPNVVWLMNRCHEILTKRGV